MGKRQAVEVALVFLVFFLQGGSHPPDVNEAHYLVKAKHFWNPEFCPGDVFCESADAHWMFYVTAGLLTKIMSLPATAWCGRTIGWLFLAISWTRLTRTLTDARYAPFLSALVAVVFWQRLHLGGEWIIGGVEAKVFAYAFVLWGVAEACAKRWQRAMLCSGIAAAFHVLVGGWSFIALGLAWLAQRPQPAEWRNMCVFAGLAVLLATPGWWPALALSRGVDPATLAEAEQIYVYGRLSHHLVFHRFDHLFILRHAALILGTAALWRWGGWNESQRRLFAIAAGSLLIAAAGVLFDQSLLYYPQLAAKILRYYFFRLSDIFIPATAALGLVALVQRWERTRPRAYAAGICSLLLLGGLHFGVNHFEQQADPLPPSILQSLPRTRKPPLRLWGEASVWTAESPPEEEVFIPPPNPLDEPANRRAWLREWQQLCAWAREKTAPTDRFLTPRHQQTFKWYAQRPEVVNWKDVPQDAKSLVVWRQTWDLIHPYENGISDLAGHSDARLRELGQQYGAKYVILDRSRFQRPCGLLRVYPAVVDGETLLAVYRLE